jgi:response regulator RpfG family c-di-GMP phosphodiesterase
MVNIVLVLALVVFTITMIIYPFSEIRIMWYFFTIMIAYYVGGRVTGHIVALSSIGILFFINSYYNLGFTHVTKTSIVIGVLFISQMSNYFVNILDDNEKELHNYQNNLEDMIEAGLKEIADLNEEIVDTQKEVVFTMGSIGESRSKETGNHVKRVAEYSKILALAYGMSEDEAELLRTASPMHDIGKVAIPDSILKKPARLTTEEFDVMKTHTTLGYEMLKHSKRPILHTAAIVSYEHHERWDGKGYPQGLKGDETHIYGRITAIADVFDALGSKRVYKPAWNDEKIFSLFKEESGHQFDPKIVELFFENKDKILEIRDKFSDSNL